MWDSLDDSPRLIRELLLERGIALKKRWGQNFMVSRAARESIVSLAAVEHGDEVWEIGPGLGGITSLLVDAKATVTVFEVDNGLIGIIHDRFGVDVTVVTGDAVKTLRERRVGPDLIVGNLPYRSAAAIISTLLESPRLIEKARALVFTVQREMARRMVAIPGTSDYSPFSVLCAVTTEARVHTDLGKGLFYPSPNVVSSVVVMHPKSVDITTRGLVSVVARALFSQRRKKISNNLPPLADQLGATIDELQSVCESAEIDVHDRAETVEPARFVRVAEILRSNGYSG